jgi:hypothetical protein
MLSDGSIVSNEQLILSGTYQRLSKKVKAPAKIWYKPSWFSKVTEANVVAIFADGSALTEEGDYVTRYLITKSKHPFRDWLLFRFVSADHSLLDCGEVLGSTH